MIDLSTCNQNDILINQKGEVFLYLHCEYDRHTVQIIENKFGNRDIKNYDICRIYFKDGSRTYSSNMMHNIVEIISN